jgi:hypothetical protein
MTSACPCCDHDAVARCDGRIRDITHNNIRYYTTFTYSLCPACGTDYCDGEQMNVNYERWQTLCESIPDYISASDILKLREIYDFSITEAASCFGISADAWCKFELGDAHPNPQLTHDIKRAIVDVSFMVDKLLASRPLIKT